MSSGFATTGGEARAHLAAIPVVLVLAALGAVNVYLKATWGLPDDGVLWRDSRSGVVAGRIAPGSAAALADLRVGDRLAAVDGVPVGSAESVARHLERHRTTGSANYTFQRGTSRQTVPIQIRVLRPTRLSLYFYLAAFGFASLAVGAVVFLRRPRGRGAVLLFVVCTLFYLTYTISFTGKLDALDWTFLWVDRLATLYLPVVFLHFCTVFPERRDPSRRSRLLPWLYALPTGVALLAAGSQVAFVLTRNELLWTVLSLVDRLKPLYFSLVFAAAFALLLESYQKTHRPTARKQVKWLVWGTGAGVFPFLVFYALPFALGARPRLALELAGYLPLALMPLSLAYAVVRHRLMEVELVFRRALVYLLAALTLGGVCLLVVGVLEAGLDEGEELHTPMIAVLCTLVVAALFAPVKRRIQDAIDRLSYRERYASRKALLHLSQEINADLDLNRVSENLVTRVTAALGIDRAAVFVPDGRGPGAFTALGHAGSPIQEACVHLAEGSPMRALLDAGQPVTAEIGVDPAVSALGLAYLFPCRAGGSVIALLGVGRTGMDPLNSEEVDLLQALAGQVATALMNARLYRSLMQKASELEHLTRYNESILESLDSGIVVLDLEGRLARWNRAMEVISGIARHEALGRTLQAVLPAEFLESLRGQLVLGQSEDIGHVYKVHLPTADHRDVVVDVTVAPFHTGPGERSGTILIIEDVTERVGLEEQLRHADKMVSIGLLAAGVAHEVNTPLAGISSYAQMLRGQLEAGDARVALLEKIEKQSFRAAKIIGSLLNFSRSAPLELAEVDVNRVILDVLSLAEHQLLSARVKLRKELAPSLPAVLGNAGRLQQVFFNLIQNARDAMPNGGWLTIATRNEGDSVVAEVRDTGDGIRREDLQRIYDPFFTTKGVGRGTGLGLSVAYGIVQDHRGAITAESTPGRGASFRVVLPALAVESAARQG